MSIVATATALALAACGSGGESGAGDEPETEGITLYSGRIAPLIGPAVELHEAAVDRDVQVRFGDSGALAATILEEDENSPADVFFTQDAGTIAAVADAGLLAPLPPDVLREVPERFRAADGTWVGVSARARIVAYGADVSQAELPESPLELVEPQWQGRVGWAPTNASLQGYITALRLIEGDDVAREWLEGMVANDVQVYDSNVPIRDAVAAGEIDIGLINHYYVAQAIEQEGDDYPVDIHYPPDGLGSLVNTTAVGVLSSSDRPEEALDFIRFLLSREGQEYFSESSKEYPLVEGIEQDPSLPPLDGIPAPDVDLGSIDDVQGTIALMQEAGAL